VYTHFTSLPLAILFIYVSHAATLFLHVQITLSHFAMSTELQGYETFYEKGLRTTMNVDCPEWLDWFHGGLQFQIEHHLFPRVPRCYFRKLSPMIKKFCKEHQLNYYSFGFVKGNGIVLGALREVGNHVSLVMNGLPTTK
jgi:delta8-fatty-acid desaturase